MPLFYAAQHDCVWFAVPVRLLSEPRRFKVRAGRRGDAVIAVYRRLDKGGDCDE